MGGGVTGTLLSLNKPSLADSEEVGKGNLAGLGNDGVGTTRWCANDGLANHNWRVDLGASHLLTKVEIDWEKPAVIYQYLVEASPDGTAWETLIDRTANTEATQMHVLPVPTPVEGRWVRITVTTLPVGTWASFFELRVFGQ